MDIFIKKITENKALFILFLFVLCFSLIFYVSLSRADFFTEHIENFDLQKAAVIELTFFCLIIGYGLLFFQKSNKLSKKYYFFIFLILLLTMITPPFLSRDIAAYLIGAKNFVWYNVNPYLSALASVKANTWLNSLGQIWWLDYPYMYGPAFLAISSIVVLPNFVHLIVAVYFYKSITFIVYLLTIYILLRITKILAKDRYLVFLYALNPAILINGIMESHNEIFIIFFLLLVIYFLIKKNWPESFFYLIISVLIKYNTLIFLPIFWKKNGRFSWKKICLSILIMALSLGLAAAVFNFNFRNNFLLSGKIIFTDNCFYRCSPFVGAFDWIFGKFGELSRFIAFGMFYLFVFHRFLVKEEDFLKFIFWSFMGLIFILTSWLAPWYVLVGIPVSLLIGTRPYKGLALGLTAYSLLHYFFI